MSTLSATPPGEAKSLLTSQGTALNRETVSDQIYARLCASLSSGELAPGDRLSIRKIGAMFGISMMPVREAVTRLVVNNALEILPNKAIRVPIMTPESFRELTTVRIHIESFAAAQAAQNRSDDELAEITTCEANFRRAVRNPDKTEALRTNKELHFAVYRASHLPTLVGIAEMLWLRVGPIINLDLFWSGSRSSVQHHRRLVQAIEARDDIEASKALTADVMGTANFILESGHFRAKTRGTVAKP